MVYCRSLGQNFCTDDGVLSDIVTAARVTTADVVIEVGPGTGNLTRHLLSTNAQITAIEKDDILVERLREQFQQVWRKGSLTCGKHTAVNNHTLCTLTGLAVA